MIHSVKVADSGNYSCVAENIVGKRISDPVPVVVRSEKRWSEWTLCGSDCRKTRWRNCNARSPDDCQGREVESVECSDGNCELRLQTPSSPSSQERSDRIVYISLIIVSVLCVVLAALFAHSKRKKPEIPDYIVTDNGEYAYERDRWKVKREKWEKMDGNKFL
jgi:netrin receptor unc-5